MHIQSCSISLSQLEVSFFYTLFDSLLRNSFIAMPNLLLDRSYRTWFPGWLFLGASDY